ncbi:MAG: TRAP transporter small permease [Burkholderiaceae bacterium]
MQILRRFLIVLRWVNSIIEKLAVAAGMAIIAFAALALFAQAVERHTTGQGYAWMSDFPPFLVPWCVFPIMGVLLRNDRHITVEIAPTMLSGRGLSFLNLLISLICLVAGVYFCWTGVQAVAFFSMLGELTETEIRIPFWWLYAAFPVGFGILALFALERILQELSLLADDTGLLPAGHGPLPGEGDA